MSTNNILIKNIYYMLSYAFQVLRQSTYENLATEEFDNIHNLFAAILEKGIGVQLKRGLYKQYVAREDNLSTLRGKVILRGCIKNKMQGAQKIYCQFEELSENNLLNQILKSTMLLLICHEGVSGNHKDALKRELLYFGGVNEIDLMSVRWDTLCFHRNNQTYRMLMGVCQLIAEGLLLTSETGENKLASFIDEQSMHRLFEKFVLEYFRCHFSQLLPAASQIAWALDDDFQEMLPVMQADIVLKQGRRMLIIDTKYYAHSTQQQFDKHTIHSNNLYQIFTYVKNAQYGFSGELHEVSGMLLYAQTEDAVQPGGKVYSMHGSKIEVKTLDLNQEFLCIAAGLNDVVDRYFKI